MFYIFNFLVIKLQKIRFMCKNVPNNLFMKLAAKNEIFMRKDDFFFNPYRDFGSLFRRGALSWAGHNCLQDFG